MGRLEHAAVGEVDNVGGVGVRVNIIATILYDRTGETSHAQ